MTKLPNNIVKTVILIKIKMMTPLLMLLYNVEQASCLQCKGTVLWLFYSLIEVVADLTSRVQTFGGVLTQNNPNRGTPPPSDDAKETSWSKHVRVDVLQLVLNNIPSVPPFQHLSGNIDLSSCSILRIP